MCSGVKYLFCDETFDGLDPVMRQGIKSILANEIDERKFTPIIASHNLRELEDVCDHVGLLHKGGVLLSKDLETMKCNIQKVQCALPKEDDKKLEKMFDILQFNRRGKLVTMTVRGSEKQVMAKLSVLKPVFPAPPVPLPDTVRNTSVPQTILPPARFHRLPAKFSQAAIHNR